MKPTIKVYEEPSQPPFYHSDWFGTSVLCILAIGLIVAVVLHKYNKSF